MQIEIQWTKADIERKLLAELEKSGFRVVAQHPENPGEPPPSPFRWAKRGDLKVSVTAEPDPNAGSTAEDTVPWLTSDEAALKPTTVAPMVDAPTEEVIEEPMDPTLLPPGADIRGLEAAAKRERAAAKREQEEAKVTRRLMKGESRERPDNE